MITRDFMLRFARFAFAKEGQRYDALYCRPVLASAPVSNRRTTYANVEPHFAPEFAAIALPDWSYVPYSAGPPEVLPLIRTTAVPLWTNNTGAALGPFGYLAVCGTVSGAPELCWLTRIDPAVSVPPGETLRVPAGITFHMDAV
ncbi:MAG: hypothetical protein AB1716_01055 [Planctomycetota bacterium]